MIFVDHHRLIWVWFDFFLADFQGIWTTAAVNGLKEHLNLPINCLSAKLSRNGNFCLTLYHPVYPQYGL